MPYLQLPDGSYYPYQDGEDARIAQLRAMQKYPEAFGLRGQQQQQKELPSGLAPSILEGGKRFFQDFGTGIHGTYDPQAAGIAALENAKQGPGAKITSFQEVQDAFGQGMMPGIGKGLAFARDQIGSNLPQIGVSLAGAKLGAMGGAAVAPALGPLAPIAPMAGAAIGAAVPSFFTQAGSNIQRQAVEQDKEGKPVDINRGAAYGAAAPQAALDAASTLFIFGKLGVSKIAGVPLKTALETAGKGTEQELLKAAQMSLARAMGGQAMRGAVSEMPTELAQQILERWQAGRPLTGPEANQEYKEVLAAAGIVGGAGGALGGMQARAYGQQQAPFIKNRMAKEQAEAARLQRERETFTGNLQNAPLGPEAGNLGPGNPPGGPPTEADFIPGFWDQQPPPIQPPAANNTLSTRPDSIGGLYAGNLGKKADALRNLYEQQAQDPNQFNGMYATEEDRKQILAGQEAERTAEEMQAQERAAREAEDARLAAEDTAADERLMQQRMARRSDQGVMLALPGLKMTPEGALDMGFVREAQSTAETGVPTAAFAKVTGLSAGFMKLDPATQLAEAEKRHAEIVKELQNLSRRMGKEARPSQVDARRRQLEAQMELLYGYGLNAPNAANQPSGGPAVVAGAADLQPGAEAPYLSGESPQAAAVQALRANAEAPPRIEPLAAQTQMRQLGIPGVGSAPASQVGPLAREMSQMEAEKTGLENILRTSPNDVETLDKLEALKSPFQQARERQMALRAREELKGLLTDPTRAWYHEGDRADLERALDILTQPAPQKSEANTRAKERLLNAALAQVQRLKANLPNSDQASDLNAALQPFTAPDTQTRDMFSGVRDENSLYSDVTPEGLAAAKRVREATAQRQQAAQQKKADEARKKENVNWRAQLATASRLYKQAEAAAKAAIEQANTKAETLFALQDKLNTVNKILAKIDKADATSGVDVAAMTAEGEGMREGAPPATPQWATNLRNQIEPARTRLREEIADLIGAVQKRLSDAEVKTAELRTKLAETRANPPAVRALKERIAQREAQQQKLSEAAAEMRRQQALLGRPTAPSAPYQTGGVKEAAAQPAPLSGTQPVAKQETTGNMIKVVDKNGAVDFVPEKIISRPSDQRESTGLNWGKSPQQKALEAEAEAIRQRGAQAARMAEARAARQEGQRGQTQDPFSTQKADAVPTANNQADGLSIDSQERLLNAVKERAATHGEPSNAKQSRDNFVYAALDLLEDPKALGISSLHAQALKWYLSALDGLTQDTNIYIDTALDDAGKYDPNTNDISLRPDASVTTLIHELAHAATVNAMYVIAKLYRAAGNQFNNFNEATPEQVIEIARSLRGSPDISAARLTALENIAKAWAETKKISNAYGTKNILEFIAEWYADQGFARTASEAASKTDLADIRTGPQSTVRRLLQKIMDRVREFMADFLGLKGAARTAFYRVSDSMRELHDKSGTTTGFAPMARSKEPNLSHLSDSLQQLAGAIQSTQTESTWQYMKRNLTGLGFRKAVLDRGAAYEAYLDQRAGEGKWTNSDVALSKIRYRQADLTSHFVHNTLAEGEMTFTEQGIAYTKPSEHTLLKTVQILADAGVPSPAETLQLYMVAKRGLRVGVQRLSSILPKEWTLPRLQEAAKLDEQYPALKAAADNERKRNDSLIDFLVQSGRMLPEEGARLKSYGDYVPFYRADDDGSLWLVVDDQTQYAIGQIDDPAELKALRGGEQKIRPYFENAITNTRYIISAGLRNAALRDAVKMMTDGKMGHQVGSKIDANTLTYYDKGEAKFFQINPIYYDEGDPNAKNDNPGIPAELVAQAFVATRYAMPAALKLMQYPARWLRYMVTRNPLYTARQLLREPLTSNFTAGNNTLPLVGALQALLGSKQQYKDAKAALKGYGISGGHVLTGTSEDMQVMLNQLAQGKTGFAKAMSMLDEMAMNADLATRQTIYASALKQGLSEPEAVLMALESMNFTRHGALPAVQVASMLVPFLNAQLQGLDVLYRSARGKMAFNDRLNIQRKFMARAAMMSGMAMMYAAAMSDEEPWKTAGEQERDMNWFVPIPGADGAWLKVPVNFEIGYLFKALPERMVALANGDDSAAAVLDSFKSFLWQTAPNPIPHAVKPAVEMWTNFSFFTGRPIETERMRNMDPSQRFNERTTGLAKDIGAATEFTTPSGAKVGVSPAMLEHFIRGYSSQLGMLVLQTASGAAETMDGSETRTGRPARELHETPLLGPMLANTRGYGPTNRFYDIKTQIDQRAATFRDLKTTDPQQAAAYQQENAQQIALASVANRVSAKLNDYRKMQARIWYSQSMSPEDKQEKLRQLRDAEIALVNRFNQQYAEISAR